MGSNGSKIVKKLFGPSASNNNKDPRKRHAFSSSQMQDEYETDSTLAKIPSSLGPLVLYRQGSMYFDEDGDLAHEFYVEVKEGRKSKIKRVYNNLKPQGKVKLPFPRLHNDCPVIIYVF